MKTVGVTIKFVMEVEDDESLDDAAQAYLGSTRVEPEFEDIDETGDVA